MKKLKQRRIYLVKPEVQFRWGLFVGMLSLAGVASTIAVIFAVPVLIASLSNTRTIESLHVLEKLQQMAPWLLGATLLNFACSFVLGVFFSHRLLGPIYRVEKLLKEREFGHASRRINLRKGDLLVDFFEVVTKHLDSVAEFEQAAVQLIQDSGNSNLTEAEVLSLIEKLCDSRRTSAIPPTPGVR